MKASVWSTAALVYGGGVWCTVVCGVVCGGGVWCAVVVCGARRCVVHGGGL